MKICLSVTSNASDAQIDPRFGRAPFFYICDSDSPESGEYLVNPGSQAGGGAGIQAGEFVIKSEVSVVLTGNVGPNAFDVLNAGSVKVCSNVSGNIAEAIQKFNAGEYGELDGPSVDSHFGSQM